MKFQTGGIYMTNAIASDFEDKKSELIGYLDRHFINSCDSEYPEDVAANEEAIHRECGRVLSLYKSTEGKIYIITQDMESNPKDRTTTIMYASEY